MPSCVDLISAKWKIFGTFYSYACWNNQTVYTHCAVAIKSKYQTMMCWLLVGREDKKRRENRLHCRDLQQTFRHLLPLPASHLPQPLSSLRIPLLLCLFVSRMGGTDGATVVCYRYLIWPASQLWAPGHPLARADNKLWMSCWPIKPYCNCSNCIHEHIENNNWQKPALIPARCGRISLAAKNFSSSLRGFNSASLFTVIYIMTGILSAVRLMTARHGIAAHHTRYVAIPQAWSNMQRGNNHCLVLCCIFLSHSWHAGPGLNNPVCAKEPASLNVCSSDGFHLFRWFYKQLWGSWRDDEEGTSARLPRASTWKVFMADLWIFVWRQVPSYPYPVLLSNNCCLFFCNPLNRWSIRG